MISFFSLIFTIFIFTNFASASLNTGVIDFLNEGKKYVKVCQDISCVSYGVINFKPTLQSGMSAVNITDTGLTGNAWGTAAGFVTLTATSSTNYGLLINPTTASITGYAWAQGMGWINFSPTAANTGVKINNNGEFSGWAWAGGPNGGWLKFDCSDVNSCVRTDWRPSGVRTLCNDSIDNDSDGLIDTSDTGCTDLNYND